MPVARARDHGYLPRSRSSRAMPDVSNGAAVFGALLNLAGIGIIILL
jgi:hypothetical protein